MIELTPKERAAYGLARSRDLLFDAVRELWHQRQSEGLTVEDVAARIGRSTRWVKRAFSGPGEWNLKTVGALLEALEGDLVVSVMPDRNHVVQALSDRLYYKTRLLSSTSRMTKFPEFVKLVTLGQDTVDFILSEMYWEQVKIFWFPLLRRITGVDPVPVEERGCIDKMRKRWVDWGRQKETASESE